MNPTIPPFVPESPASIAIKPVPVLESIALELAVLVGINPLAAHRALEHDTSSTMLWRA